MALIALTTICLPASSFFSSLFNGCETRSARRQLVPKLTAEWVRPERRGTRSSLVTAGLRKDAIVLRLRHTGCPSVRTARGFASPGTTSASGWPTRGSRDRSNSARAARREECAFSSGRNCSQASVRARTGRPSPSSRNSKTVGCGNSSLEFAARPSPQGLTEPEDIRGGEEKSHAGCDFYRSDNTVFHSWNFLRSRLRTIEIGVSL